MAMVQIGQRFFASLYGWVFSFVFLALWGCSNHCPEAVPACSHSAPTNELCLAYFQSWFFNESTNQCQKIGYSGCGQYGFATQAECEACRCAE